ncbi:MAG: hypothetical protein PVG70_16225 [Desulfobacterales bacterium]|jgi:hypothetical protein
MQIVERFFQELLKTKMDISLCRISSEGSKTLRVVSKVSSPRIIVGLIFILPALFLLAFVISAERLDWLLLVSAALLCPLLFSVGVLFAFVRDEIVLSPVSGVVIRRVGLPWFKRGISVPLPSRGRILLWKELDSSDNPCWWFNICCFEKGDVGFTIADDRARAIAFAKRLADFLSWHVEDDTEPG